MSGRRGSLDFAVQCRAAGLPAPVAEWRFAAPRRWRFDYCWPASMLALEVDGGVFMGGRHTRGVGFMKDCEKLAHAAILGWRVMRVTPQHIASGEAISWVEQALRGVKSAESGSTFERRSAPLTATRGTVEGR